jgi:preprotein translocase subunit YajC
MDISFILILALAAGAMFLMTSRTRKQQREAQNFRANLAPGQEVMTGSGMFGTIVEVDEEADVIVIESTPGNQSRWLRAAIAKLIEPPVEVEEEPGADEATDSSYGTPASDASGPAKGDEDLVVPDDLSGLTDERPERDRRDDGTESK